jgi:hypothetical protein
VALTNAEKQRRYRDRKRGGPPRGRWHGHQPSEDDVARSVCGNNADAIARCVRLHVRDGSVVADVTYGLGAFWRKTNLARFTLLTSDILHEDRRKRFDFRHLPYADDCLDVVVLDPPYATRPTHPHHDERYRNGRTTPGLHDHDDVMGLYRDGMCEAVRVLVPGGMLWVKVKDDTRHWTHCELYNLAVHGLGLAAVDLFVVVPKARFVWRRPGRQRQARKSHSYLWVFRKLPG